MAWRSSSGILMDGCAETRSKSWTLRTPANNDWLAVNQFTVTEDQSTRRPDVVLFVNGLPLGIIELKNPADEDATIWSVWPASDVQGRTAHPVLYERGAGGLGRYRGPHRYVDGLHHDPLLLLGGPVNFLRALTSVRSGRLEARASAETQCAP